MEQKNYKNMDNAWKKIIHFEIEEFGKFFYLCNKKVNTNNQKRTSEKEKVTCRNCLNKIKDGNNKTNKE